MGNLPERKHTRLQDYDYSQNGAYFITVCVGGGRNLLGVVAVGAGSTRPSCLLSPYGRIVERDIQLLSEKYPSVVIDKYVIMPNHVHCIMILENISDGRVDPAPTDNNVVNQSGPSVTRIMGYFKYQTTKDIAIPGFWQRSYNDHIIRDEADYQRIWQYIDENPPRWTIDKYYIAN